MAAPLVQLSPRSPVPARPGPALVAGPRKPGWLKVPAPGGRNYLQVKAMMRELGLHTVCEEARCPNIGECWEHHAATFMILGDVCTRNCTYCAVAHGTPQPFDPVEPVRLAEAVERMRLRHVVITSVDRDDLPNGGAEAFAGCVTEIRRRLPDTTVEVLIPDFKGSERALRIVLEARPAILNHNLETAERLYRALTLGVPREGVIRSLHARDPRSRLRFTSNTTRGREAVTHVRVAERLAGGRAALVECRLETGRTHQIRVHLLERTNTPILGDPLYAKPPADPELAAIATELGRQALHAAVLGFVHPVTREHLRFETPLPDDISRVLERLRALG